MFSDESRLSLRFPDFRERAWTELKGQYAQCNTSLRDSFNGVSVIAWVGISREARTNLVGFARVTVNGQRYVKEVSSEHKTVFAAFFTLDFAFVYENPHPRPAKVVQDYLRKVKGTQARSKST